MMYIFLFAGLLIIAAISFLTIFKLKNRFVKAFLSGIVGALLFSGDFLLIGLTEGEPLREHFIFPDVLALSAYFLAGAIAGIMLSFVRWKKAS